MEAKGNSVSADLWQFIAKYEPNSKRSLLATLPRNDNDTAAKRRNGLIFVGHF